MGKWTGEAAEAYQRRYRQANKERIAARFREYKARNICGICWEIVPGDEMSIDHIVPLSRGGHHVADNLQVAHLRCNSRKGAKLITEMPWVG